MANIQNQVATPAPSTASSIAVAHQVKLAISDVVQRLDPLHREVAFIAAKARLLRSDTERVALLRQCEKAAHTAVQLRAELIVQLMDSAPSVTGHSRVIDLEKSIDTLERAIGETRTALSGN
jgi:hypothetical protein